MTSGSVVSAVFPHWECDEHGDEFRVWIDSNKYDMHKYTKEWWNSPYRRKQESH